MIMQWVISLIISFVCFVVLVMIVGKIIKIIDKYTNGNGLLLFVVVIGTFFVVYMGAFTIHEWLFCS